MLFARAFRAFAEKNSHTQTVEALSLPPALAATRRERPGWLSAFRGGSAVYLRWQWGAALAALALLVIGSWLALDNARLRRQMNQTQATRDASSPREQEPRKELEGERSADTQTAQELTQARAAREQSAQELQRRNSEESHRADRQQPQSKSSGGISIASFVLTPQVRGGGQLTTVNVRPTTDRVVIRLELEPNEYQTYRVTLLDSASRQTLWRSGQLRARTTDSDKTLSISFRARLLQQQSYVLQVEGVAGKTAPEMIGAYPFRVVK